MSKIIVEVADDQRRTACYRLAYDVFHREMGTLGDVVDHDAGELCDELAQQARILCARSGDEVVGSIAILLGKDGPFPDVFRTAFDIERFATAVPVERMAVNIRFLVRADMRATTVPFALITETARLQRREGVVLSFADCQPHLLTLYQSLGFRVCGPSFDQPGFGMMVPLVMIAGDDEHLAAVQSPLIAEFGSAGDHAPLVDAARRLLDDAEPVEAAEGARFEADLFEVLSRHDSEGLFSGLTPEEIARLTEASHVIACRHGQQVVASDQGARTVFIVLDGEVDVSNQGRFVCRLGPGQPFGDIAFLLGVKRTADVVVASESARVLALSDRVLQRLLRDDASVAARLLMNLSRILAIRVVAGLSTG